MNARTLRRTAATVALAAAASAPHAASAAVPPACSLLTIGALARFFPGATVTPPEPRDAYDCSWAADVTGQSEDRVGISIRPDVYGRWAQVVRESKAASGHAVPGLGVPAVYDVIDGISFLKGGYIVQVSLIGTSGAVATAPKEAEIARAVAAKFSV